MNGIRLSVPQQRDSQRQLSPTIKFQPYQHHGNKKGVHKNGPKIGIQQCINKRKR